MCRLDALRQLPKSDGVVDIQLNSRPRTASGVVLAEFGGLNALRAPRCTGVQFVRLRARHLPRALERCMLASAWMGSQEVSRHGLLQLVHHARRAKGD